MTTEPKIEKGVPVPSRLMGMSKLIDMMEDGDSVFFESKVKARSFYTIMTRDRKLRATCRKVEGGYRVWKLEGETNDKEAS